LDFLKRALTLTLSDRLKAIGIDRKGVTAGCSQMIALKTAAPPQFSRQ
jgi:hypothetical protein